MQSRFARLAHALFVFAVVGVTINAATTKPGVTKAKTYRGKVGDALCGLEHSMPGSAIECIRECIGKGSRYSLIVGDRIYALDTDNQAFLDVLEKQGDAQAEVTGTESADGKLIAVKSVKAVK